jgi:hypothetical protein
MWVVAFVLVLLVVVAVAVAVVRRPRGGDVHSVRNYNQALGTLEHLSERIGPPAVRPIARQVAPGAPPETADLLVPPVPVRGTDEFPDPDAPIVFDDARPANRTRIGAGGERAPSPRSVRAQRMALDSMNHRRRGGTGIVVVMVVVGLFAALAFIGRHKPHTVSRSSSATTTASGRSGSGTGRSTMTSRPKPTRTSRPTPTRTTRPTPTTLPKQLVATDISLTGTSAVYTVPYVSFQITATGTGPCWVEVDSAATGKTVWTGVLAAGSVQNIQATGATTVKFGTPTLALAVNAIPVIMPSQLRTPFSATFTPSAAAVAAAAAAVPTTTTITTTTTTTSPSFAG